MTAPKPGDRVRVTVDGYWHKAGVFVSDSFGAFGNTRGGFSSIEVLPTPVYANHDTTEYRIGDVVRDANGEVYAWVDADWWWRLRDFVYCPDDATAHGPLTLLVRNGKAVGA